MSEMMKHYIGGLLVHSPALLAFCAPTTNSYRRLVPGFEAGQPGLLGSQPQRMRPNSDVLLDARLQEGRVPAAGPLV
jgi:hypothetical protein